MWSCISTGASVAPLLVSLSLFSCLAPGGASLDMLESSLGVAPRIVSANTCGELRDAVLDSGRSSIKPSELLVVVTAERLYCSCSEAFTVEHDQDVKIIAAHHESFRKLRWAQHKTVLRYSSDEDECASVSFINNHGHLYLEGFEFEALSDGEWLNVDPINWGSRNFAVENKGNLSNRSGKAMVNNQFQGGVASWSSSYDEALKILEEKATGGFPQSAVERERVRRRLEDGYTYGGQEGQNNTSATPSPSATKRGYTSGPISGVPDPYTYAPVAGEETSSEPASYPSTAVGSPTSTNSTTTNSTQSDPPSATPSPVGYENTTSGYTPTPAAQTGESTLTPLAPLAANSTNNSVTPSPTASGAANGSYPSVTPTPAMNPGVGNSTSSPAAQMEEGYSAPSPAMPSAGNTDYGNGTQPPFDQTEEGGSSTSTPTPSPLQSQDIGNTTASPSPLLGEAGEPGNPYGSTTPSPVPGGEIASPSPSPVESAETLEPSRAYPGITTAPYGAAPTPWWEETPKPSPTPVPVFTTLWTPQPTSLWGKGVGGTTHDDDFDEEHEGEQASYGSQYGGGQTADDELGYGEGGMTTGRSSATAAGSDEDEIETDEEGDPAVDDNSFVVKVAAGMFAAVVLLGAGAFVLRRRRQRALRGEFRNVPHRGLGSADNL